MAIHFTKMEGAGNDFVIIDAITQSLVLSCSLVRRISDRHYGIGCDQLLLVEAPRSDDTDFFYRIFNRDGKEVSQCGNGARCLAKFIRSRGLSDKDKIVVGTLSGKLELCFENDKVIVDMGAPTFNTTLTFKLRKFLESFATRVDLVFLGNEHLVVQVEDLSIIEFEAYIKIILAKDVKFHEVNIEFVEVLFRDSFKLRVYERGSLETLSCGSGACAAMAALRRWGLLDENAVASMRGGDLNVRWKGAEESIWLKGGAVEVFTGVLSWSI